MYNDDYYTAVDHNDNDNELTKKQEKALYDSIKQDRGLNVVTRKVFSPKKGKIVNKQINVYTSSSAGSNIRDAETGEYYSNKVGTKDEDLFFKVILATGECNSPNGSSTLFYCSPQHYVSHLHEEINLETIAKWEVKRDARLKEMKMNSKTTGEAVLIK